MSGIYLAFNSSELTDLRTGLLNTLVKAGQQVFPTDINFNEAHNSINSGISSALVSVHILGLSYGDVVLEGMSLEQYQYEKALQKLKIQKNFKIFLWFPFAITEIKDERQRAFISGIRNNIMEGQVFSNVASPIQLVDDLRSAIQVKVKTEYEIKDTDVFLVHNQLDDNEANEVVDMLSDIIPVEKLNIVQDSDIDYSEFCAQQIGRSKLAVIYFKESADWALPFTQQIWKKIGGASSHTPLLMIGDDDPDTNMNVRFKAPKVVSLIVAGQLIPLEIKVQYDKIVESAV
jgi:hypothetical protein